MNKRNWQKWAVPVLMGFNLLFLGFMLWQQFMSPPGGTPKMDQAEGIKDFLREELQLDAAQWEQYQALIQVHQVQSRQYHDRLRSLMDQQIRLVSNGDPEHKLGQLAQQIGEQHAGLIRNNFEHFSSLREILQPEQQQRLGKLLREVMFKMGGNRGPRNQGPPPKH